MRGLENTLEQIYYVCLNILGPIFCFRLGWIFSFRPGLIFLSSRDRCSFQIGAGAILNKYTEFWSPHNPCVDLFVYTYARLNRYPRTRHHGAMEPRYHGAIVPWYPSRRFAWEVAKVVLSRDVLCCCSIPPMQHTYFWICF